ncbi:MAG: Bacterial regulatory protein, tetR family [Firmicutes bacterium]|nr:Bacterial regulatory protein, tetR family [Bacillota bacterium]
MRVDNKITQDAKEKLLAAGTRLFAEKGFAGVSIRELATAAGVNSALISYHFGGKEGLYEAVITAQYERLIIKFEAIAASTSSVEEKIRMYADVIRRNHTEDQPLMARLVQGELSSPTACMEKVLRKYTFRIAQIVSDVLRQGIQSGNFRQDVDPVLAALSLAGMLNFYFILREITKAIVPEFSGRDQEFVDTALKIYLKGMGRD